MAGSFYIGGFAPKSATPDQLLPYCKRISANVKHPSVSYTFIVPKSALSETAQVQKGRRIGISFGKGATEGSNPASYPKTAIGIYGFFNKKSGSKNPEMVDATGFFPVASKPFGFCVTSEHFRCRLLHRERVYKSCYFLLGTSRTRSLTAKLAQGWM